jgi:hypothetical protein
MRDVHDRTDRNQLDTRSNNERFTRKYW